MATKKENLSIIASDFIRKNITDGKFKPGEKLVEADLAKQLEMSRGPIREALNILKQEGMIDYETNKGCTVLFLSPQDAWEIFFMRGNLEKLALEVCSGKIPYLNLAHMKTALDEMKEAVTTSDSKSIIYWDNIFHMEIVKGSNIKRLLLMWKSLSPLNSSMFYSGKRAGIFDFESQWEKHNIMYDILLEGDLEKSCNVILDHYIHSGERIYKASHNSK